MITILILYNLVLLLLAPLFFLYFFLRKIFKGKSMPAFIKRLGLKLPPPPDDGQKTLWIHAVSVGEVLVVAPLIELLEKRHPDILIYLSTSTPTGHMTAEKTFGHRVRLFYCPFDLPGPVSRVLKRLKPGRFIIAETELWPNLLWKTYRAGVPISIVNGRISDNAFGRYRIIRRPLKPFMHLPNHFLVQSEQDAQRFQILGAPESRTWITGNMKFDSLRQVEPDKELAHAIQGLFGHEKSDILLCGSTMEGEEEVLARVFQELHNNRPALRMVVAPRHPERFQKAAETFVRHGFHVFRRSRLKEETPDEPVEVVILDSLGELSSLYHMADVVFIGGTMVPTGGHNVLEPAAAGSPIVVGPSMENFHEILALFHHCQAIIQVLDPEALGKALESLLKDPTKRRQLSDRARDTIVENQGAALRNFQLIYGDTSEDDVSP